MSEQTTLTSRRFKRFNLTQKRSSFAQRLRLDGCKKTGALEMGNFENIWN